MKFKSLITTTLALGVLASTGANFNNNEASAAAKPLDNHQVRYTMDILKSMFHMQSL
ncbi:cell surface protein [Staphylococcus aureus]|nr:cell surface protein [Staphylococcus aureus]